MDSWSVTRVATGAVITNGRINRTLALLNSERERSDRFQRTGYARFIESGRFAPVL